MKESGFIKRGRIEITELDGNPAAFPYKIKFPNTSITDNGDGTISISFAGIYLLATGVTIGATSQAQAFTNGVITGKIYPSVDSTTGVQINKADGTTNILNIDTTNLRVGIGTNAPTAKFSVAEKGAISAEGGIMVNLTAGENLVQGEVVHISTADENVYKNPIDGDMPIGVVYADATAGNPVWIVHSGRALVLPNAADTAVRNYIIYSSSTTAGRVSQSATLPSVAAHNREVGHWLSNGSGAGVLTYAILHWN